jgi:hypothetical protein
LELLHAYVHNAHTIPQSEDLKRMASNLAPFFKALWPSA